MKSWLTGLSTSAPRPIGRRSELIAPADVVKPNPFTSPPRHPICFLWREAASGVDNKLN